MSEWKIYHNPQCSKSREALALLKERGIEPEVVEYLKTPLTSNELRDLISKLGVPCSALVRTKEELYQELGFDVNSVDVVIENLVKYPRLLERPIVEHRHMAVLGRPIEHIETLLESK
jgi:arsenate reductase